MAGRRLLTVLAATLALASSAACTLGPIYTHHVAGRIVDHKTRQPIAGAEVFMSYEIYDLLTTASNFEDMRWTTTDEQGRFEFPAHFAISYNGVFVAARSDPTLRWVHPKYGVSALQQAGYQQKEPERDWRSLELTMVRDDREIKDIDKGHVGVLCDPAMDCLRACTVWFGGRKACLERAKAQGYFQ